MISTLYVEKQLDRISYAKTSEQKQDALYRLASHVEAFSSDRLNRACRGSAFTYDESLHITNIGAAILFGLPYQNAIA